jgi:hypothetical protein
MTSTTLPEPKLSDAELAELMRYDPEVDRVFEPNGRQPRMHLGHECNTPIYVLDSFAWKVSRERPPTWPAKVSWRFPMASSQAYRLVIRPTFAYLATPEDQERWMPTPEGCEPFPFTDPDWVWDTDFSFATQMSVDRGRVFAGGKISTGCYASVTLTRYSFGEAGEILLEIAETIEALAANQAGLLARESDSCCFCGRALVEPRSRAVGYGPDCAQRYALPY